MTLFTNIYTLFLCLAGLTSIFLALKIYKLAGRAVKWFGLLLIFISIWAIAYGFELSSQTLEQMKFWLKIEYIGISFLPVFWLAFILLYLGKERWMNKFNLTFIFLIPIITLVLVWTNDYHHFHYLSLSLDTQSGPFPLLAIKRGLWYRVFISYFYFVTAFAVLMLFLKYKKSNDIYKKHNTSLLIGSIIPWVANVFYLAGVRPYQHIDLTPFAFMLTGLIIGLSFIRFRLFDIIPVAREKVIDAMSDGILVLDTQNRIVDANRQMLEYLNHKNSTAVIGSFFNDILPFCILQHKISQNRVTLNEEIRLTKGEDELLLAVDVAPIFDDNRKYGGAVLMFKDITSQKKDELKLQQQSKELQALNQLKSQLFSIISHDLRSPLVNLVDVLNLAEENLLTEMEFKTMLPKLSKNIAYTFDLLENLLFWSKNQFEGALISPEYFNLKKMVSTELHYFQLSAKAKGVKLKKQISGDINVFADLQMIRLVVRNLLSNAIKFCHAGSKVLIGAALNEDKSVVIYVEDSGVGMGTNELEMLQRQESFTIRGTQDETGTGLGLLLCHEFVKKNKGQLFIESELNKGSKFSFTLPVGKVNEEAY
ncbi:histidine kinase N-terminal 7TM domain-containing protein [Solitalea lacus]|uniref:sensor histidine kinase n=1 Tax=Solitalea lacus TaxID=2911172 RepID=UPI001EDC0D7B|nr:histidine kinase N-terminal 7TM domain-containing protein [Solitalea lacus]UKJ08460.1 ATP-binding protein [Solitalea lacus]